MKQILKSSAIALIMAICISCTPSGEYVVFAKEIRGRQRGAHVLILKSTRSGGMHSKYVSLDEYYGLEIGDTITIQ